MPSAIFNNPDDVAPFNTKSWRPYVAPTKRWTELGYEDPVIQIGRWRPFYYTIREKDPLYYDPDVTDTLIGSVGVDSTRANEMHTRFLPGKMSVEEWRDRHYFLDPNVRAIYEQYPIAKQHPGLMFRVARSEDHIENKNFAGSIFPSLQLWRQWPGVLPRSWRFTGAPMGEQCHVKTAVAAKYGLFLGTGYFIHLATTLYIGAGWRKLLARWWETAGITMPSAAAWAAASCLAGSIRGKDDIWNMWVGGAGVGVVIGSRKGFYRGWYSSVLATAAGLFWYYAIASEQDIIPHNMMTDRVLFSWDPASYKWNSWESSFGDPRPSNF